MIDVRDGVFEGIFYTYRGRSQRGSSRLDISGRVVEGGPLQMIRRSDSTGRGTCGRGGYRVLTVGIGRSMNLK